MVAADDYFTLAVIRHRFGLIPSQIASSLLSGSKQTIQQIVKSTGLEVEPVAAALTALLQHDIVQCHLPQHTPRPPKLTARSKKNFALSQTEHYHNYESTTSLQQFGDVNTRLYGNQAAGYLEDPLLTKTAFHCVYQSVLPLQRTEYDSPQSQATIEHYLYSINRDMVRGVSRCSFYSALAGELFSPDEKFVLDEFCFRGKLTISMAIEYALQRLLLEEDSNIRQHHKLQDGSDQHFTSNDINNMTKLQLESLSIWHFDRIRLEANRIIKQEQQQQSQTSNTTTTTDLSTAKMLGGINARALEWMDEIELSRFEALIPRVVNAFQTLNEYHLLVSSPGFIDLQQVSNPSIFNTSNSTQTNYLALNGVYPKSINDDNNNNNNNNNNDMNINLGVESSLDMNVNNKKRKLVDDAITAVTNTLPTTTTTTTTTTPASTTTTTTTTTTPAASSSSSSTSTMNYFDDDDDLFDPDPLPGETTVKKQLNKRTKPISVRPSGTSTTDESSLLSLTPYQNPLPKEQQLYILNHDRFTLLYMGEMMLEYISKKVSVTAGLLIAALNFDSLRYDNPSQYCEYTLTMAQKAFMNFIKIRQNQFSGVYFSQNALEQLPKINPTVGNIHADYPTILVAVQHLSMTPITKQQLLHAFDRLTRQNLTDSLNKQLQYVITCNPSNQTQRMTIEIDPQLRSNVTSDELNIAYVVQYHKIIQSLRQTYLLTHAHTLFGLNGRRVFSLLMDHSRLEDKQVSDLSLVPKRDVKEILHRSLQDGFIDILEVPTSTDKLSQSKVFYLYGIDYVHSGKSLLSIFYKSYANTLLRLDVQREQSTQFVDKHLLIKHMELDADEALSGRDYKITFARFMHVLYGIMKAIIIFKDLTPR